MLRYLHVQHQKVYKFIQKRLDNPLKFGGFYKSMKELENTDHKVLKSKHFS